MRNITLCALALLPLLPLQGETELDFKGTAETIAASAFEDSVGMTSCRNRFRPELEIFSREIYFKAALDCVYDDLIPSKTGLELQEIYMEYTGNEFDLRAGRQIISWGKADGIQITDIISPKNRTEFVGIDYEDSRLPVNALKIRQFRQSYTFEFIWIPLFTPSEYPTDSQNPLRDIYFPSQIQTANGTEEISYNFAEGNLPENFEDGEIALRLSFFLPQLDLSLSAFSGWEDDPEYHRELSDSVIAMTPEYYRIMMYGIDAAVPVNAFVFRCESALFDGKRFSREETTEDYAEEYTLLALVGLDWNPGDGWTLTAQYAEDFLPEGARGLERDERESSVTLSISKSLFRETLEVSCFSIAGMNNLDSAHSLSVEYLLSDNLKVLTGAELYFPGPDEEGDYGALQDISSFWLKGQFSF